MKHMFVSIFNLSRPSCNGKKEICWNTVLNLLVKVQDKPAVAVVYSLSYIRMIINSLVGIEPSRISLVLTKQS